MLRSSQGVCAVGVCFADTSHGHTHTRRNDDVRFAQLVLLSRSVLLCFSLHAPSVFVVHIFGGCLHEAFAFWVSSVLRFVSGESLRLFGLLCGAFCGAYT